MISPLSVCFQLLVDRTRLSLFLTSTFSCTRLLDITIPPRAIKAPFNMYTGLLFASLTVLVSAAPLASRQSYSTNGTTSANSTTGRPNPTYTKDELDNIKLALSAVDRYTYIDSLGSPDDYFKFDYSIAANGNPVAGRGQGGQGDLSYVDNWPALLGTGVAMSFGFLNPCKYNDIVHSAQTLTVGTAGGMNTPHTHNRATELLSIVSGGNVKTSFVQESGLTTPITTTLSLYQGAIFPMGSLHYEFNGWSYISS